MHQLATVGYRRPDKTGCTAGELTRETAVPSPRKLEGALRDSHSKSTPSEMAPAALSRGETAWPTGDTGTVGIRS